MIALAIVALACIGVLAWLLNQERARVAELLALLEAKAAPAEYAGYVAQAPDSDPGPVFLFSDDGLIGIPIEDD